MLNKNLYKYVLILARIIPMVISGILLLNVFLTYFWKTEWVFLNYISGVSLLTLLFIYLSSFAFGFKLSQRIFIYYIAADWIVSSVDYFFEILSVDGSFYLYISLSAIALIAVVVSMIIEKKHVKEQIIRGYNGCECETVNKAVFKYELLSIKVIPMVLTAICILNSSLSYFYIDWPILSFLGGASFLMILFMYLTSVVFKFCAYHRIFIHFLLFNCILNLVDWYVSPFPDNRGEVCIIYNLIGIAVFVVAFVKSRKIRKTK